MRIKIVDVDISSLDRIEDLDGYDAVEILFRAGREPLGRARLPCNGDFLDLEKFHTKYYSSYRLIGPTSYQYLSG